MVRKMLVVGVVAVGGGGSSPGLAAEPPPGACTDGRPCTVDKVYPAGKSGDGQALSVVELSHGPPLDRITDFETQCPQTTWWRVGGGLPPVRLLALCNDGYGASGVGEDSVSVGENSISLSRYGGSAWRWSEGMQARLDPLALIRRSAGSFHAAAPEHDSQQTEDLVKGVWKTTWTYPKCTGHAFLRIPIAVGDPPPAEVPLGTCSARATASGDEGFVAWGEKSTDNDGRLAVVARSPNVLVVDVWDDEVVQTAESWVSTDHLELWVSDTRPDLSMDWDCDPAAGTVAQWAIDWSGAVHPAKGATGTPPKAEVHRDGRRTRVSITLPTDTFPDAVTVVFSDAELRGAAPRQERLIATSPVSLKAPHRLGDTTILQGVRCASQQTDQGQRYQLVPALAEQLAAGSGIDGR
jgi:hypothetical protein